MLQAAVIRSHLEARLGREMTSASSYLSCYAGQAGQRWRELGEAMDRVGSTAVLAERIAVSASEGFRCLLRWRMQDLARTTVRYAG